MRVVKYNTKLTGDNKVTLTKELSVNYTPGYDPKISTDHGNVE